MKNNKNIIAAILWGAISLFWIVLMIFIINNKSSLFNMNDGIKEKIEHVNEDKDMLNRIEKILKNFGITIEIEDHDSSTNYKDSSSSEKNAVEQKKSYSFNAKEISALETYLVKEALEITEGGSDKIEITIISPANYPFRVYAVQQDSTIRIKSEKMFSNVLHYKSLCSVKVAIPSGSKNIRCNLNNTSGKIYVSGLSFTDLEADNTSGSIHLTDVKASTIKTENVSGSTKISDVKASTIKTDNTSGSIHLTNVMASTIKTENVSGSTKISDVKASEIYAEAMSASINISNSRGRIETSSVSGGTEINLQDKLENSITSSAISGSIRINIPKDSDFSANYNTTSGGIHTSFNCTGKKSGTISNGKGKYSMNLSTVSGSINVN